MVSYGSAHCRASLSDGEPRRSADTECVEAGSCELEVLTWPELAGDVAQIFVQRPMAMIL